MFSERDAHWPKLPCYLLWSGAMDPFLFTYVIHLKHPNSLSLLPKNHYYQVQANLQVFCILMTLTLHHPIQESPEQWLPLLLSSWLCLWIISIEGTSDRTEHLLISYQEHFLERHEGEQNSCTNHSFVFWSLDNLKRVTQFLYLLNGVLIWSTS